MAQVDRFDQLHREYVKFCCTLENQHEGLCNFVYKQPLKDLEKKLIEQWSSKNLTQFVLIINSMRNIWMNGLTKYTQQELLK